MYLSNVGISDGHSVDAIAKVSIIPTKDSDPLNTRYFLTSGRDYLSVASKAGGGASVSLTFLEHKDQADFDNLYNSVQLSQTTKESLLQSLDSIKGETEAVSGLLNVYDLDDYSATKSKDKRKSITFDRDEISKLYVSNETTQRASAILELNGDQVTLTSGPEGKGDTLANNKKVTVTYENQSQLNYTITGTGSSGPAFLPDGLLLLEVPPYHVEDVATTTGQDDQFVIHQTVPMRDVRKPITLPKEITLGVQVPEGVKLSLKENTTSLFTADKSASTSNQLTIVPGKNGVKNLDLLKQQTYYNKIYDMPITASHDLTLADIENNTAKWQQLQQYYDKDEEVLKVPITYTFKNGVETWDDLTTDKPFAVMNVSDEIKNTLRKIDEAAAAVEAAKVADQAAKDALATANTDSLITPTEQAALEAAQQEAVAKKTAATDIVNALPESYRGDMPATLAGLTGINVPAVNDQNENGIEDSIDTQLADAQAKVDAAKAADKAAQDALTAANADGLISQEEADNLADLAKKAADAKTAAETAVSNLPTSPEAVKTQKDTLTNELAGLNGITVPAVNDKDGNGVADDVDAQVEAARQAVEEAKAADKAAKDKLDAANADGLITPTEKAELEAAQQEAQAKKDAATEKVNALPEENKGNLPTELSTLTGINVPEVNDQNENGVDDQVDAQLADTKAKVDAAKAADQAAQDALTNANADGVISQEEADNLADLAKKAEDAKTAAETAVSNLPEAPQSVKDQKDNLTETLNGLDGITVPEVNDADSNGVVDDVDAQREEAEQAVEEAKAADQAAKDALTKANEDGLITPTEQAELEAAQKEAQAKKDAATEKVNALPEDQKGDLPTELNALTGIDVPEVNDENANGVADDVDAQVEEAKQAVEAAKTADEAAKNELEKANADGVINPEEAAKLADLAKQAEDAKTAAEEKVNALPEEPQSVKDQKDNLTETLNGLNGITVPAVNDEDSNGVADDVDAQVEEAKQAVEAAKMADQAAKDALTEANADGVINPEEAEKLADLAKKAEDAKKVAEEKVNALPEAPQSVKDQKDSLTETLNGLDGITVPAVNDEDSNGVADDIDGQRADAETAVEEAKQADQAAKDALVKAEEDGLITPTEKAELEAAQQEAADKKATAQEKVDALPEDQKGNLPAELSALTGIDVPAVNDQNENGINDQVDTQLADAKAKVDAAKEADKAAQDALTEANADGVINPEEAAKLADLAKQAEDTKTAAETAVSSLPDSPEAVKTEKDTLTNELSNLNGITVPAVNDADANGVADDVDAQREDAEKAVEEAKQADKAAKDALTEANADGLITPAEKAELERLQEEAQAKKDEATDKVNALPEDQKGDLPSELDKLTGIEVPEVNDSDANGVADDVDAQREDAEKAVEEAKAADQAAKGALAKAQEDGLITPAEKAELEKLQEEAQAKKETATDKVNALPEDQKGDLPSELDKLTGIEIPEVNDADANGVADDVDAQREDAEKAVEEAKQADQAAKDALAKAEEDGLITPDEKATLEAAQQEAADKKAAAEEKVNALPEDQKGDLPSELDALTGINVPAVNDENANGVADDIDAQVEEAKQAVEAAKTADQVAKDELEKANADGVINPEEAANLTDLAKQAEEAKTAAEEKVNALPDSPQSVKDQKDNLTETLNGLDGITVPEVNDADSNGVADDVDAQREDAEKAVEEAKQADQAAKDALTEANADGLITPAEKAELERLQEEAQAKKDEATDKVNALPEDQKGDLPAELDALTGIDVPAVNDENANGVADDVDAQVEEARQAVEAAKTADQAAKDALTEANEDGVINPEEAAKLADLAKQAEEAKTAAEEKVNALPEKPQSVKDQKDNLTETLNGLDGITVPEVNDADANGVADDVDAQREDAEKAVEEAKTADQAAKDALAKAEEDGLITPAEKAELEAAAQEAADKKAAAEEKVNALPEDQKGDLPSELDKLTGIEIPEVNDADANGVADDVDAQRADAEKAVEEAKTADQTAKDALAKAEEDGLITPAEKAELEAAAQEAADKKAAAEDKVNALPEDQKGDLPAELDKLTGIEIPEVNDADANGVADDVDAQRADAEKAVEEAKQADQAAKDALAKANEDGLITPAEKAELEKLQEEAQAKKETATDKVNALPEDQKGDLPSELDKLTGIEVPEVNDSDANGVADDVDAQREDAEKAVEEAKAADQAAKDALAKAEEDGLITPAEKAELEAAQQEAVDKKAAAEEKVNALPEDQKGDLPSELDKLTGIEIPEVNDADANGVADDVDAQRADAEKAVEEAKAADQAAKDALVKANEDGLITPAEKAELEKLQEEAKSKKDEATDKVNALPENQKGDLPSELDKLTGIEIPEVNDADANGVADDVDAQRADAEKAVEEAKEADQAAKDALAKAEEDRLITPAEKAELEAAAQEAADKKSTATEKVNALPEDQKGDLPAELDKLTGIEVPEVNDADSNGVADDVDAQREEAEKAVEEAKAADQAAKDALAKAEEDGLITPAEKAELEAAAQEAADKKAAAEEKVNALPEDQKGDLPSEIDKLTGIEIPEVNDADANGVADDVDAQREEAEKAVEEAKAADQAAKDALAKAEEDGLITPAEKAELEKLQEEAQAKKDEATDKVNALPEDQKGDLPSELDKLTGIEIPEVNDADANGVADDIDAQRADAEKAVEEAKQADQAAKDALAKANEDGLITPAEKAELEAAAKEVADKKAAAEEKVNALPENQKGDLPSELDKLTGIEIPEANDADSNGVADDVDAQREEAEKAVEEAKAADQAAKDALAKANEDGLITPAEKAELEKLQEEAQAKKDEATDKVNTLPEDQRGDLPAELDKLTGIEIPEVNDADSNGVADDVDAQREEAEKAVEEAKQADQAAKDALVKAEEDGLITPAEKAELETAAQEAADKKSTATEKVNALPEDQKGDLPAELDKLTGIEIPEVNDADSNDVADDVDAQRADAEKAVEEAKAADQAAKDALAKAEEDGLITPAEKAELEALAKEAADKKAAAEEKVNALPEDQKGDLPTELDKLTGIEIPEVNDADANGVADDVDAQRADAEKAVEEAKAADQAAKDALAKAEEDGLITPAEKAELEKLQEEAQAKKDEATDKVNALPESQKGDLPTELDKLTGIEVPEVNDADSNGVADDVDAQRADAEKAVEEAKAADQAAKDALAKANEDGLITPAEKAELEKLQEEAADKKAAAEEKVNALPENQKGDLPSELDKLTGIEVPEVNDADANGVADDVDAQRADAEKAVEEAKQADQAAKDALAKAEEDGLITPAEKAELEKLQEEAKAKKDEATDKVNALPENQKGDLPTELDKLTGIEVPEVNDADANGVADDVDAQRADAEKAVEEAKAADQAAKDALAKAQEDGIITPAEKAELEALAKEAADKKATATDKVNALPEDQRGDLPSELAKLTGIEVPEVTNTNTGDTPTDQVDTGKQQEPKAPVNSPVMPKETSDNTTDVTMATGKVTETKPETQHKSQNNKVLPETGQESQQTTLFGSLFAGLGALLFFRRRKNEEEESK
ncbi:GA-like domain-containing protein [Staphylococcus rostri]|nr:LPXTG cell wall anchor domain-containing protein [Staphylococcus rostri]